MKQKVAYVAGPYRAHGAYAIGENIRRARDVAISLWRVGYAVICPHTNTAFFDGAAPDEVWLEGDLELLRRSDIVVLGPGWEKSTGATAEKAEAERVGIPALRWEDPREKNLIFLFSEPWLTVTLLTKRLAEDESPPDSVVSWPTQLA